MTSISDMLVDCELLINDNLPSVKMGHNPRGEWMAFVDNEPEIDWRGEGEYCDEH